MTAAQVLASSISVEYGERTALAGLTLSAQGGVLAVLGPNGAGKTTLLRCLASVVLPSAGELLVDGLDARFESDRIEIRRRLGYVPQDPGLARGSRVYDVIDYLAVCKGFHDDRARRRAVFASLDEVGLRDRANDRVSELSGGMRQRLGVAQALLGTPTFLVLDEPASGLDPDERLRLRSIVAARRRHATVILSTHLTDEAASADRLAVLDGGRLTFTGSPQELAALAAGRVWLQSDPPPPGVRASWQQADGSHRCLGTPPPDAIVVPPSLEEGYLLLRSQS